MILVLCYLCPPLAVLLMGKPVNAVFNVFLTGLLFWIPGIKHALVCYADYKADQKVEKVVDAINHPAWVKAKSRRQPRRPSDEQSAAPPVNNPYVGMNGTVFGRKP